ncbi:transmembrane protein, putative (macronuclear) [Tetrahymena thermophila SB210]|uniref:Transmembrane protein, putative n=1 Tax=Tetrahymena thermophila (strain SB210) TaxID=312017 RepID=Q23QL0_TETTS|nr:transmembrane protein, putative [Tetrahymena thermophila SB210]EAR98878.2 transmembrane protein, putative [Tetrahymena thermophila SB210]|eukprot:XP_001019123.2 transmembrane protein, putative [Tetrahymena thermophila SB210]
MNKSSFLKGCEKIVKFKKINRIDSTENALILGQQKLKFAFEIECIRCHTNLINLLDEQYLIQEQSQILQEKINWKINQIFVKIQQIRIEKKQDKQRDHNMKQAFLKKRSQISKQILYFYQEELYQIVNVYPRNKPFYSAMTLIKHLLIFFFSLQKQFSKLIDADSNYNFLKKYGIVDFMKNYTLKRSLRVIFLSVNGAILLYIAFAFARNIFKSQKLSKQIDEKYILNRVYSNEENKNEKKNQIITLFSFFTIIHKYILYVPSVFLSLHGITRNPLAIILLLISILLNVIISDVDYNYEIKSIDYLAKPFSYVSFIFNTIIEFCFFLAINYVPNGQSILLAAYFLTSAVIQHLFCQFYNKNSQFLSVFSHISLFTISIIIQVGISFKIPNLLISILTVAYLPICFKIANIIIKRNCQKIVDEFQSLILENQNSNIDFDKIIRLNLFEDIANSRESERRDVQLFNLIINSDIDFSNSVFVSPTMQKSHSPHKFQKIQQLKQENNVVKNKLQSQIQQTLQIEQFNDNAHMVIVKDRVKRILKEQFKKMLKEKQRNKQSGFYEQLIYFVFLIEVNQSYRIYWLQQLELSVNKNLSMKQKQMFYSVHSIFLKKRSVMRKLMGRSNPFDCSFLEVIVFEKRLEQSYVLLDLAVKLKLEILNIMKQKEIKVNDLIQKIELMQQLKRDLKVHLNSLCYMNDDSLDLLNIQALFLENLAFSEKDINLMQVNKYKKKYQAKLRHKYLDNLQDDEIVSSTLNNDRFDEKTCIVFANYKDQRTLIINSVSSNFQDIFYFTTNNDIKGHNIESIIPFAFQPIHSKYIENYLDEEISCSTNQDQKNGQILIQEDKNTLLDEETLDLDKKNEAQKAREKYKNSLEIQDFCEYQGCRMNRQIIFAQINHMLILPVRIDLRVNYFQDEKTFGLTAKIKHINYQYEYVLYEEDNLNVIGLTDKFHYTFFPNKESLAKISIKKVFPFLAGIQDVNYNKDKLEEKNEYHNNLTEQMENILKEQQKQKKNQPKRQKINFIVIQEIDPKSGTMLSTAFSLASSKKSLAVVKSTKQLKSMYVQKDLSSYTFTFVQLSLHKVNYRGIEDISYIEIQKMRQLNPYEQAPYILSQLKNPKKREIYEKYFQTNQDLEKIIIELEQKAILCNHSAYNNQASSSLQAISALNNFLVAQNSNNQISIQSSSLINNLLPQNQNQNVQTPTQQKSSTLEDNQNIEIGRIKSGNIILDQDVISEQEEDELSVQGLEVSIDKKDNNKKQKNKNKQQLNYQICNKQNSIEINNNMASQQNPSLQDQNFIHSFQEIQQEDHVDNQFLINNLIGMNDFHKNMNYYQNQSSFNEKSINNEMYSINYNQNTFYNNHMYNEIDEIKIQQSSNQLNKLNTTNNDEASRIGLLNKQQKQQNLQYNQQQIPQHLISPVSSEKALNLVFFSPTSNQTLNINDKNQQTATSLSCQELKFFSPRATQQSISNLIEPNQDKKINNEKNRPSEWLLSPKSIEGQTQRSDQDFKFTANAVKLSAKDKTEDNVEAKANQYNIQIQNQNYISQPAPRGTKTDDYSKENTKFQHREEYFSTSTPFGYNQQNNQKEDKNTKKLKVQEIQYDIASTNSKDSSSASAKRQLQQIMADKSLLQIIKVINILGILCFCIMICLTWVQYGQTINNINASYFDYQVFNWPTQYQSYLSSIVKYQNINYMVKYSTDLKFANLTQKSLFRNQTRNNLNYIKSNIINLIAQMERASTERKIFQLLRNNYFIYYIGQYYDPNQLSNTPSIPSKLLQIQYNTTLQYGVVLSFSNIYRSFSSTGNGTTGNSSTNANSRAEYYMISNEQQELQALKDIQNKMVTLQQNEQQGISDQLTVLMVLIITINGICFSIILPLYYYIQKERDVIISLFATFSTYKIDSLIKQIQRSYYNQKQLSIHSNKNSLSIKQTIASLQSLSKEKDVRKQNISSITKLPRFNPKIAIIVFFIYLLIICYPIIVKIVTQDYLAKTILDLQTMKKVYQLRSYLLENIAINFNVIVMKINPTLKPMSPTMYYDYLNNLNQQQQQINTDIQWIVSSQYQNSRYNQNLYDSFFFSAFKKNLCDVFNQYPQYNTNSTKLNTTICDSTNQGFLQQGFEVAYKQTLYLFPDLYRMYTIPDNKTSVAQISQFLSTFNIIDYMLYTEFLDECIVSLNQFILSQNDQFYDQIILFQIILISIQIILMVLVFFLGWVSFSSYLNDSLHETKNYLQILDINTLIENTYILTYIKKNSTI